MFFYGTLMDPDVLAAVIGRRVSCGRCRPAALPGYRRVVWRGASYPVVIADPVATVDGLIVGGLRPPEVSRLQEYEGGEYRLESVEVDVRDGGRLSRLSARIFLPQNGAHAGTNDWSLQAWQQRHKRRFLARFGVPASAAAADGRGFQQA